MGTESRSCVLLQRYELGRLLGQGTFAKVFFARNIRSSQSVAIKVIEKQKVLKNGLIDQIKREISVMRLVRHPNIVRLHEVMATKTKIYFVLEFVRGGELFNKVSRGRLREEDAKKYFQQLIGAVHFCHGRGAFHRDLKPENLLLDDDGNLKVSDFGLSALADSKRRDGLLHTACGTPAYVAPEVISGNGYDGAKADIWSCGVILFVLMAGYLPFNDSNLMEMYRKIEKAEFRFPNWFPPDVRRLIRRILDPNPAARIAIEEIKANPWFSNGLAVERAESAPAEGEQETGKPINLNAFDIISLSAGFDLSGLFEEGDGEREARFASNKPVSAIIAKLEEVAGQLSLKIKKKDGGVVRMEGSKEGRKGVLAIDAEIFEVIPSLRMVEIKKTNGDTMEYQKLWKQDMRPALEEIEWARQDGRPSPQPPPRQLGPASGGGDVME